MVNPSGRFIISKSTFPEYFRKDDMQESIVDCNDDLLIFGAHIAPILNITKRFIGEEPFCNITKQYNNVMKKILPLYNIEVIEIKRFAIDNEYISASKVRKLLNDRNFKEIERWVPKATYIFLKNWARIDKKFQNKYKRT